MRTRLLAPILLLASLSLVACDKPTEADCRKAVENINKIHGLTVEPSKLDQAVRKCQSSSTKASVQCNIAATDVASQKACDGK
jgi:hypothetical protein